MSLPLSCWAASCSSRGNELTKRFGERTAFSDVSFQAAYGEVFGFLGSNGAGKTTTVRTLGTSIAATSGATTVVGIPLNAENGADIRKRISIVPELPGLYWRLTVYREPGVLRCSHRMRTLLEIRC